MQGERGFEGGGSATDDQDVRSHVSKARSEPGEPRPCESRSRLRETRREAARNTGWTIDLHLSRGAVFHSGPSQPLLNDLSYRKQILWI